MSHYQNKKAKKYAIIMMLAIGVLAVVTGIVAGVMQNRIWQRENQTIANLLLVAKQQDQNWKHTVSLYANVLNGKVTLEEESLQKLEQELLRYGIKGEYIYQTSGQKLEQIFVYVCIMLVGGIVLLGIFFLYLRGRKKQVCTLENYMDCVVNGVYDLQLSDNSEDELSNLQNQMYKVTIMLREQAKQYKAQKVSLAESVEDISHQLKTPLTSTTILLDNLLDNPDMPLPLREKFTKEAARQVQGMNWMILSMLKLSRLDAGVVEMKGETISLWQLIEEVVQNLEVLAEVKQINLHVCNKEHFRHCTIQGDYKWNREAVQNIVKNGIEHSTEQGTVDISVDENQVYTAIRVTNRGETISPETQKLIFERHFSDSGSGENSMGIGIPLAKAILEKQNGYLSVESENGVTTFVMKYKKW